MSRHADAPNSIPSQAAQDHHTVESAAAATSSTPNMKRRRIRPQTSLFAYGEPMVWLTGGALVVALLMIAGLLSLIVYQGVTTFWPQPITQVTTHTGRQLLGEVTRDATFEPTEAWLGLMEEEYRPAVEEQLEQGGGFLQRKLLRTGNFRQTGTRFTWIENFRIAESAVPEWAVVLERTEWGPFYGFPTAFLIAGELVAEGSEATWAKYVEHHDETRERAEEIRRLERVDLGRINTRMENARLDLRRVELEAGKDSPAYVAAQQYFENRVADLQAEGDLVKEQIETLRAENDKFELIMTTVDEQDVPIMLADVVRGYPANQLTFSDRAQVYLSRWAEFLTDEPREANQEGGVYPAIFGTVVMTLIMCIAVVPFGVLAALYLREYAKAGPLISAVRIAINNLAGVPSIVFGVFGLGFFSYIVGSYIDGGPKNVGIDEPWEPFIWKVLVGVWVASLIGGLFLLTFMMPKIRLTSPLWMRTGKAMFGVGWALAIIVLGFMLLQHNPHFDGAFEARLPNPTFGKGGLLWASLTLALLTLPVVIVATEEALAAVPNSMREGSYACGASKWQTIKRIVLPRAMPGIMTGMILAMARGAGEVAPLMVVGAVKLAPQLPVDGEFPFIHAQRSFMHLGFHIYDLGFQSPDSEAAKPMVFTTTLLLITIVAALNITAILIRSRLRRKFSGGQF